MPQSGEARGRHMRWISYLFGFRGRISCGRFWAFLSVTFVCQITLAAAAVWNIDFSGIDFSQYNLGDWSNFTTLHFGNTPAFVALAVFVIMDLTWLAAGLAQTVKRLHDRNKGAAWLLAFIVLPLVLEFAAMFLYVAGGFSKSSLAAAFCNLAGLFLWIWAFAELLFLRGTAGDNRFGRDPLAGKG